MLSHVGDEDGQGTLEEAEDGAMEEGVVEDIGGVVELTTHTGQREVFHTPDICYLAMRAPSARPRPAGMGRLPLSTGSRSTAPATGLDSCGGAIRALLTASPNFKLRESRYVTEAVVVGPTTGDTDGGIGAGD